MSLIRENQEQNPKLHTNGAELHEEDLILCKTDITDTEWYLAEINNVWHQTPKIRCHVSYWLDGFRQTHEGVLLYQRVFVCASVSPSFIYVKECINTDFLWFIG